MADISQKGLDQSFGMMVNYHYELMQVEANHESYAQSNEVMASKQLKKQATSKVKFSNWSMKNQ